MSAPIYTQAKNWADEQPPRRLHAFESMYAYRYKRCLIGIEEHCSVPLDFPDRPSTTHFADLYKFDEEFMRDVGDRLTNIKLRVETMDKCGVAAQLLSLAEPGTQGFCTDELEKSKNFARRANDWMHDAYCKPYPKRFFGLACVPTQDPQAAADELERAVKELGFKGCLINGATPTTKQDHNDFFYLDHPSFDVFWAKVQELDVPVFMHPRAPPLKYFPMGVDYPAMQAPTWGFTRETCEHVMRIMLGGVFDRFPGAKLILGHLGEGLSFSLPRTDARMRIMAKGSHGSHKQTLQYYFNNNVYCLSSGHFQTSALQQLIAETGHKNVQYSDDYPFESIEEHTEWWKNIPVGEEVWKDMSYKNALKWFKLPADIVEE